MVIFRVPVIFLVISQQTSRVINDEVPIRSGLVSSISLQPQIICDNRRLRGKLLPSPAASFKLILKPPDSITLALTKAET